MSKALHSSSEQGQPEQGHSESGSGSQDEMLNEQATELERLLPRLMSRLFTLDPDHPVTELPLAQLRVCIILQAGPRTLSAISEELGISVSATTQIADRLERAGLVERVAGQDDRRTKKLQLSPLGGDIMRTRRAYRVQRVRHALTLLPPEQRLSVIGAVEAMMTVVDADAPENRREDPAGAREEQ